MWFQQAITASAKTEPHHHYFYNAITSEDLVGDVRDREQLYLERGTSKEWGLKTSHFCDLSKHGSPIETERNKNSACTMRPTWTNRGPREECRPAYLRSNCRDREPRDSQHGQKSTPLIPHPTVYKDPENMVTSAVSYQTPGTSYSNTSGSSTLGSFWNALFLSKQQKCIYMFHVVLNLLLMKRSKGMTHWVAIFEVRNTCDRETRPSYFMQDSQIKKNHGGKSYANLFSRALRELLNFFFLLSLGVLMGQNLLRETSTFLYLRAKVSLWPSANDHDSKLYYP